MNLYVTTFPRCCFPYMVWMWGLSCFLWWCLGDFRSSVCLILGISFTGRLNITQTRLLAETKSLVLTLIIPLINFLSRNISFMIISFCRKSIQGWNVYWKSDMNIKVLPTSTNKWYGICQALELFHACQG